MLSGERVFYAYGPTERNLPNLLRNIGYAWTLVRRLRPKVIVTTGAGLASTLRMGRAPARSEGGLHRESDQDSSTVPQLPPRKTGHEPSIRPVAGAGLCGSRNSLCGKRPRADVILITTGTNAPPFDRLLQEVEAMNIDEAVVVQHGPSALRPTGATCVDYVSFDRFVELVREARIVVTHAGVGSILITLMNGKRPFVVPRLAHFGEHVDDHQLELGRRLSEIGVVKLIEDPRQLESAIRSDSSNGGSAPARSRGSGRLANDLAAYLDSIVGGRADHR